MTEICINIILCDITLYHMMVSVCSKKNVQVLVISALKVSYHIFVSTYGTFPNLSVILP